MFLAKIFRLWGLPNGKAKISSEAKTYRSATDRRRYSHSGIGAAAKNFYNSTKVQYIE